MAKYAPVYMTVYDGIDIILEDLDLDTNEVALASPQNTPVGNILNATDGSTLSMTVTDGGRFKLVGSQVQVGATALTGGNRNVTVRETLSGAENNPHDTVLTIAVTA